MTEELKPLACAHCGHPPAITSYDGGIFSDVRIRCLNCKIELKEKSKKLSLSGLAYKLINKWNRRASPWVRVEDGLPPMGRKQEDDPGPHVSKKCIINMKLTAEKYMRNQIGEGWYDYQSLTWILFDFQYRTPYQPTVAASFDLEVTHWMPIPPLGGEDE